jgi:exodeoxyribonuclease V alpha subunit
MKWDSSQLAAIEAATARPLTIIAGGAGVGKTACQDEITRRIEARGETVLLMAFAGKAAARQREATQHAASTIHRALAFNGKAFLMGDLSDHTVIIDESSMVPSDLLAEVMQRKPRRLILVGDPAQLPPVGRGQPFADAVEIRKDLVFTLAHCYRADEAVFKSASIIRAGGRPPLTETSEGERWEMRNTGDPARTQAAILKMVDSGDFDFETDIILVSRNGKTEDEACTVRSLNKAIAEMVSPRVEGRKFNVGDRVINTHNLPDLDMWNGSTGEVHSIDQDGGIWVKTDVPVFAMGGGGGYTSHVLFSRDNRKHLQLAYALTTHKSQGSQYRKVILACFNRDVHERGLLDRKLLYTGVTRTKNECLVVGELSSVYAAIQRANAKRTILQQLSEGEGE